MSGGHAYAVRDRVVVVGHTHPDDVYGRVGTVVAVPGPAPGDVFYEVDVGSAQTALLTVGEIEPAGKADGP